MPQRVAPPPTTKGPIHIQKFTEDLRSRTPKFTAKRSSTSGLLQHLENTKSAPTKFQNVDDAVNHCEKPRDPRLKKYMPAIRALVRVWGSESDYVAELKQVDSKGKDPYSKHLNDWSGLTVTDPPNPDWNGHGLRYKLIDGFAYVDQAKGAAAAWTALNKKVESADAEAHPEYWMKLGAMAIRPHRSGQGLRYVRCFSCAAIATYSLVKDPEFNAWDILVVAAPDFDHYFVVVGDAQRIRSRQYRSAIAVDLWQSNIDKSAAPVCDLEQFYYAQQGIKICCEFSSDRRVQDAALV